MYIEREIENHRLKERINTLEDEAAEQDAKLQECLADKHAALSEQAFQQEARPMLIKLREQVETLEAHGVAMKAELSERDHVIE